MEYEWNFRVFLCMVLKEISLVSRIVLTCNEDWQSFRNREINDIVYYVQEEKTVFDIIVTSLLLFDIWIAKKGIIVH